jgi:hypothetical protein
VAALTVRCPALEAGVVAKKILTLTIGFNNSKWNAAYEENLPIYSK